MDVKLKFQFFSGSNNERKRLSERQNERERRVAREGEREGQREGEREANKQKVHLLKLT